MSGGPRRGRRGRQALLLLALAAVATGCAAGYSRVMGKTLSRMERRDYPAALEKLEKPVGDTNLLLYRLEKGLILHYQGDWQASNRQFDLAERVIDRLYTRSVSRELAALLTNDAIRPYSGEVYERVLIHYYRALNYNYLGDPQGALVECRKANLRLADYAEAAEYKLSYRNDAFLQYLTGMFFEANGETNDAYISYRDAAKGYAAYAEAFGMRPPAAAAADLQRAAQRLGFAQEWEEAAQRWGLEPGPELPAPGPGVVTVFAESGFVGRKTQREIDIPILEDHSTTDVWMVSERAVHRYRQPGALYRARVKYWLRVALPVYEEGRGSVTGVRLRAGDVSVPGWLVEDLTGIAGHCFKDKEDTVLLRAVARALAKYLVTRKAEKESDFLGALVNLLGVGTEAADTRSWLSLPRSIWMARVQVPAGTADLVLEFVDAGGRVVDEHVFPAAAVAAGGPAFLSWRSFR